MKAIYLIFLLNYFSATTTNPAFTPNTRPFSIQLSEAALAIINPNIKYDPTYCSIKYPNGDVPKNKGVCTDVVGYEGKFFKISQSQKMGNEENGYQH